MRIRAKAPARAVAHLGGDYEPRTWAIESANGLGYLLAQQLLAAGERVLDVPATLASRVRVLGTGRSNKNDPNDARSVAIAALRSPALTEVRAEDHVTVLRLLAKRHLDLGRWRNKVCCRLHARWPSCAREASARKSLWHKPLTLLAGHPPGAWPRSSATAWRSSSSRTWSASTAAAHPRRRINAAVAASGTTLTELFGVGPVDAAILVGHTGDPRRFANRHRYATYNATAPIEFSSGGRSVHRLSRRGNRQLNHALHMAAVTQIRHRPQSRPRLLRPQAAEARPKEALRALKRRISDVVYRRLVADARAPR